MEAKKSYVSLQQKTKLIEIVTNDKNLITGKFSATFSYKDTQKKWEAITSILNSFPGAKKDWKQWRKTWQDIRTKTKNKNSQIRKYTQGTGGGPSTSDALTDVDIKVLATMSSQVLQGSDIPESEISFQFPNEQVSNDNVFDGEPLLDHKYYSLNVADLPSHRKEVIHMEVEESNQSSTATYTPSRTDRSVAVPMLRKSSNATTILADVSNNNNVFDCEQVLDHNYSEVINLDVTDQCHEKKEKNYKEVEEGTKTNIAICTPSSVKSTKRRSVAAQRLLKSSNATTILADVSNKDLHIREKYYEKKLKLMERLVVAIEKIASAQYQTLNVTE